ncbi:hypothetical protein [Flocculibacter collagenilyticus]|uniref:hypothetical protein n=1 Tax=Flocculibacter collagenilyticus TaxID=2744479 RepID=UPI0018F77F41|nr:hypothetical protein [Flocculibacter collagenilyticus]
MAREVLIISIVLICVGYYLIKDLYKSKLKYKQGNESEISNVKHQINQLSTQIQQQEDRIKTLEAIVTDEGYEIKKQFKQL